MDSNLASGDNTINPIPIIEQKVDKDVDEHKQNLSKAVDDTKDHINNATDDLAKEIDENEGKLKERIAQCRTLIDSLKTELKKEKDNLSEPRTSQLCFEQQPTRYSAYENLHINDNSNTYNNNNIQFIDRVDYTASIDSRLSCDENLVEYEKQLQIYQNTLNMAQLEKKNAIRKQMMAKAFKLKLQEVENQCNIELLRVKQSLQCLEPLQMIASNWKSSDEYDLNNYDLIPRFPELKANSAIDLDHFKKETARKS